MKPAAAAGRSKARRFVLQGLYQIAMTGHPASQVESQLIQDHEMKKVDTLYLHELFTGVAQTRSDLDEKISVHLSRELKELDAIEHAVLLIGAYELSHRIDIPYKVAINEGVQLARQFGASESHKLVNSVLDLIAQETRDSRVQCVNEFDIIQRYFVGPLDDPVSRCNSRSG